jgi:hypothetical protein
LTPTRRWPGFDFDIRHRFEDVMQVDIEKVGG